MSDPLLDLKFLPDWLKETSTPPRYANYQDAPDHGPRDRSSRGGPSRQGGGLRDSRGPRDGGGRRDAAGSGGPRSGQGGRRDDRSGGQGGPRRGPRQDSRGPSDRRPEQQRSAPSQPETLPAPVKIHFLPEPNAAANIAKQIRQSAKAYPLFGTARMFLEKPERHALRITSTDAAHLLHQLDHGPVGFDSSLLDRNAFRSLWTEYYKEEATEVEPPKGNYTSVALCRSTGHLLGPTNHHAYQVALRRLYEERFSRRMSFAEFQREEVEVVTSEQAVADWKAEVSKQTVYHTLKEDEPIQFKTLQEVEVHFRKTYLPKLLKSATTLECSGKHAREIPERALLAAAREAFDKELAYPGGLVHGLRAFFDEQGLQVFKHRKRVLYVSAIRPKRATATAGFAEGPATLLSIIGESPRISKRDLAVKILGAVDATEPETPEHAARKTQLASDLHYLVHTGHVIEFADGRLDLPLAPTPANGGKAQAAAEDDHAEDTTEDELGAEEAAPAAPHADEHTETHPEGHAELPEAVPAETHAEPAAETHNG